MKDDKERLRDILEAIGRIEKHAARGHAVLETDELVQVWMVHHLQVIGEAARRLSDDLRGRHPEIPWPQIIAMRNILVHDYFAVDLEEVWSAVERDLPDLKKKITAILDELGPAEPEP
ncbi:MAG: DUF86 domain-containing protein [Phycisphaerae bacterium]